MNGDATYNNSTRVQHTQRVEVFASYASCATLGFLFLWLCGWFILVAPVVRSAHVCLHEAVAVFRRHPGVLVVATVIMVVLAAFGMSVAAAWLAVNGGCR